MKWSLTQILDLTIECEHSITHLVDLELEQKDLEDLLETSSLYETQTRYQYTNIKSAASFVSTATGLLWESKIFMLQSFYCRLQLLPTKTPNAARVSHRQLAGSVIQEASMHSLPATDSPHPPPGLQSGPAQLSWHLLTLALAFTVIVMARSCGEAQSSTTRVLCPASLRRDS